MRKLITLGIGVCALVATAAAAADGGPGPGVVQGWDGVTHRGERFVAVPSTGWTTIQVIQRNGGRVVRWLNIEGSWGIPLVAFTGRTRRCKATDARCCLPHRRRARRPGAARLRSST